MANLPQGTNDLYNLLGGVVHPSQATDAVPAHGHAPSVPSGVAEMKEAQTAPANSAKPSIAGKIIREVWIYGLVFIVALLFYFAVVTNSLSGFANTVKSWFPGAAKTAQQQTAQVATAPTPTLTAAQLSAYSAWIKTYYYNVSDPSILDPNNDISGGGLTNYQKFLLGLNPRVTTTLVGSNMTDAQDLIAGIDPLTGGPVTAQQKQTIAANIDLEEISNKLTLTAMQQNGGEPEVAGAVTYAANGSPLGSASPTTLPLRSNVTINQAVNGELDVPSLGIAVPLIFTQNTGNLLKDLPNGVVHYPGTPLPGDIGTSYISGHSSNYSWIPGKYNKIFATLNNLKADDSFSIKVTDTAGKVVTYDYVVLDKGIFTATDQQQFANIGKSTVALSTCWPVGTSQNRLVVFGELTQVEQ